MYVLVLQDSELEIVETRVDSTVEALKEYISDPDNGEWFDYGDDFDLQAHLDQLDGVGPTIDFDGFYVTIQLVDGDVI